MFRVINADLQEDNLYTCSIWHCHSLQGFVMACRYTACVRTDWPPLNIVENDSTICCIYTIYPPEDEHLSLETYRGELYFMNK